MNSTGVCIERRVFIEVGERIEARISTRFYASQLCEVRCCLVGLRFTVDTC